jgi:hypothetical protein
MGTWIKCTNDNGQDIYANLENATTLFRDEARHRGTSNLWEAMMPSWSAKCQSKS